MEESRLIAFYLPQYHPIPENDQWWGKGFTEWTNVAKAKPLFKGHKQPKLPADLGFYDLRVPEVRELQASLARESGVHGFCYWHYWFGNGRRVLERPLYEVLESGRPNFPFCLGWANESWSGRWHGLDNQIIIKQEYPGREDYIAHFYEVLPAFLDNRYIKVGGEALFYVYKPELIPSVSEFIHTWQELATKEGIGKIHFVCESHSELPLFDAFVKSAFGVLPKPKKKWTLRPSMNHKPRIYEYQDYVHRWVEQILTPNEYPVVLPNWDNTPRSGCRGFVLNSCHPDIFKKWVSSTVEKVSHRAPEKQLIFIKSWNEWAEGNYLEPDQEFGLSYLIALKEGMKNSNL